MNNPKVSVILPTYNAAQYLEKAIESILSQSFHDFELIIIDDGSTDQTPQILAQQTDPRVTVLRQSNQGLPKALNNAIRCACGQYLARQDADDKSLPLRLEKQVNFLDSHTEYALVGTWAQIATPIGLSNRQLLHPQSNGQLQVQLLTNNQFAHSSVMIRTKCLESIGLYSEDPDHFPPEDYDLWLRIAKKYRVANIPEILLEYFEAPNSISRTKESLIETRALKMAMKAIEQIPLIQYDELLFQDFINAANGRSFPLTTKQYLKLLSLTNKIGEYINFRFPEEKSEIALGIRFLRVQMHKTLVKSYINRISKLPSDLAQRN